jgi:hypothetical protein
MLAAHAAAFNVNLAALKDVWESGDVDFLVLADQTVTDAQELRKELIGKGWFGNGFSS